MYIRYDDAIEHLRRAIEVRGEEFVYPDEWRDAEEGGFCQYLLEDGEPGCIVGQVLYQMGADAGPLEYFFGDVKLAIERLGWSADETAVRVLQLAQNWQDEGYPWGKSVMHAIEGREVGCV